MWTLKRNIIEIIFPRINKHVLDYKIQISILLYVIVRFHLYKENKDTQEALGVIGKMLGIQVLPIVNYIHFQMDNHC